MKITCLFAAPVLLASTALAQPQLVRGDIDGIQGTNRFQLECTQIPWSAPQSTSNCCMTRAGSRTSSTK